ncbi:hypothetical protein NB311A_18783, partial [Nitrobacter sp. Nb-311A]
FLRQCFKPKQVSIGVRPRGCDPSRHGTFPLLMESEAELWDLDLTHFLHATVIHPRGKPEVRASRKRPEFR